MSASTFTRTVLERVLGPVRLRRRLPRDLGGGALTVTARAGGLKYWNPLIERIDPSLFRLARRHVRPGDVVWDIGANVGLFSAAAAGIAGPTGSVLAVEADADVSLLLRQSFGALDPRRCAHVSLVQAAVTGPEAAIVRFRIAKRARAANAIVGASSTQMGGVVEERLVPGITLDGLLASTERAPALVKIDVEGHEESVLAGAKTLLARHRPTLFVEVGSESADAVGAILREHGYRMFDGDDAESAPHERPPFNCLALHPSRGA
ncbi:MAG: FkbM family methyltransferase [Sandaracinaceae bacterium]|nr:FkbM family methyltransferase [Sandaracinaceae bacterium]